MSDHSLNEINGVPLYQPGDPYHHDFDNKPIKTLAERDQLILGVLNVLKSIIDNAAGDLGSLPLRLDQSIDPNGNLKPPAVDQCNHNIANHLDGSIQITQDELNYYHSLGYAIANNPRFVRFLDAERAKLSLISDRANKLVVSVVSSSGQKTTIDNGEVNFQSSDTIEVSIDSNNALTFSSKFPVSVAHRHYYQIEPSTTNYINYSINGVSSYKQGSLRVYVNGTRVEQCSLDCGNINFSYYPSFSLNNSNVSVQWKQIYFTENTNGGFSFSSAVGQNDRVLVDYDLVLI